ncbi:UNVERIFIED_ORG: hypothetical protein ABIC54_004281 [Burkholderia sp. 1263]
MSKKECAFEHAKMASLHTYQSHERGPMSQSVAARRMGASGVKKAITLGVKQRKSEIAFARFMKALVEEVITDNSPDVGTQTRADARLVEASAHQFDSQRLKMVEKRAVTHIVPVDDAIKLFTSNLAPRQSFDARAVFRRQAVPTLKPLGNVRLTLAQGAGERGLRADDVDGSSKRVTIGVWRIHGEDHK